MVRMLASTWNEMESDRRVLNRGDTLTYNLQRSLWLLKIHVRDRKSKKRSKLPAITILTCSTSMQWLTQPLCWFTLFSAGTLWGNEENGEGRGQKHPKSHMFWLHFAYLFLILLVLSISYN